MSNNLSGKFRYGPGMKQKKRKKKWFILFFWRREFPFGLCDGNVSAACCVVYTHTPHYTCVKALIPLLSSLLLLQRRKTPSYAHCIATSSAPISRNHFREGLFCLLSTAAAAAAFFFFNPLALSNHGPNNRPKRKKENLKSDTFLQHFCLSAPQT